ncbi:MAG: hypothetical protein A4E62_02988 [Syntrophorhabdus sp. PtaU1.Bin002]|nr:MAG: hypothetical protein A4E62_02988 [Syntrophorhabdus sp. PtaU1.Bin002]
MMMRTSYHLHVCAVIDGNIICKECCTGCFCKSIKSRYFLTEYLVAFCRLDFANLLAEKCTGGFNRFKDFNIAGTPAEMRLNSLYDFIAGRLRVLVQKGLGPNNHTRRTETALDRTVCRKGKLNGVRILKSTYPFYSYDLFVLCLLHRVSA